MGALRVAAVLLCLATLVPAAASGHSGVPRAWWLDERTAVLRLREAIRSRYEPKPFRTFRGECRGRPPLAVRDGRRVYNHFFCSTRIRANGMTYSFRSTLHVTGPRGRVTVGG